MDAGVFPMMFATPKSSSYVAPQKPIDPNAKYLVRVREIKDEGVSQFADAADADPPHNLSWTFALYYMDKTPVLDIDGNVYLHRDYTSNRTGKGGARTAKAREWIEALLGRAIEDSEITASLPDTLLDKIGVILFEVKEASGRDGVAYERLRIMRMSPYKSPQAVRDEALAEGASPRIAGAAMAAATRAERSAPMTQAQAVAAVPQPAPADELPWN
jgi:hypothetical protein